MSTIPHRGEYPVTGYLVGELIYDGSPSRVYRAQRESDGLPVMLKSLADERAVREARACLKHEFEMIQGLNCTSVIRAYGLEQHNNMPIVVLEDFGGASLEKLAQQGRFSLEEALRIGVQLAKGLEEIHRARVIHKDINPSNVIYNRREGVVKIIDFGDSTQLTREQAAIASPRMFETSLPYISPEQTGRMNRSIDYRTDFYSCGATLHELLTGTALFRVNDPIEWLHCHIARQPQSPADLDPSIPRPVSDIVMKLVAKMAEDRYQSARGIQVDLQHCLDQLTETGSIDAFALGRGDKPHHFQIPQRLYGRDKELATLLASFEHSSQGGNQLVMVSGYSGLGKTCLVKELCKPVTERRGHFVAGKFDKLHRSVPYSAVAEALRDLVRQLLTETEEQLTLWRCAILDALGTNGRLMVDMVSELELIIGPQEAVPKLPPTEAERRFHRVFHRTIQAFAQPDHPLVIFLDDLQWADSASLKILELLTDPESNTRHLLVIGAYRDNEVQPGHPLSMSLQRIRSGGGRVDNLSLRPLSRADLSELLADTLGAEPERLSPLTELVEQKTAGNPFFTEEFLKFLHREGLITFSPAQGNWIWEMDRIRAQQMTDNVVELMTDKLQQLEAQAQNLLQLGACTGTRFQLSMLAVVSELEPKAVAHSLRDAISQGMIAPIRDSYQLLELDQDPDPAELTVEFAFAHDRIRQAAYSLLNETRRCQTHLKMGRLLQARLSSDGQEERLFDIANHLNLGADFMDSPEERLALCRLNLAAGKRAKASTAYHPAHLYFQKSLMLLDRAAWQNHYELALELYTEAAEAAYLIGEYESMEALVSSGFAGARELLDQAPLYLVRVSAHIARGEMREAVAVAKPVLSRLGHHYPAKANKLHVMTELGKVLLNLRGTSVADLHNVPDMTDPHHLAATQLGGQVAAAAMFTEPHLLSLMVLRAMNVALKHGYPPHIPSTVAAFGMVLAVELRQPERGKAFGLLAEDLTERLDSKLTKGRVKHVYNALVRHWCEPLRNTLEPLHEVHQLCLENGDYQYALLGATVRTHNALDAGMELPQLADELAEYVAACRPLKQGSFLDYLRIYQQMVENFQFPSEEPTRLSGTFFIGTGKREQYEQSGDRSLQLVVRENQMLLSYLFGDYRAALAHAPDVSLMEGMKAFFKTIRTNMFDSLIRLALAPDEAGPARRRLLRQVARNQTKMKRWVEQVPANCLDKYYLVEAERQRVRGRDFAAHALYDKAIGGAQEQGFIMEQALANERCGEMHMAAERPTLGEPYLASARDLYQRWGAGAKVNHMQQQYPQLIPSVGKIADSATLASVDITSLTKALKAIAVEKVHSRMVQTIITSAVEFAGAQYGLLVLRNAEGQFCVEGEVNVDGGTPRVLQSIPVAQAAIAQTVVNYVARSGASVLLHDAQQADEAIRGLDKDPYLRSRRVRSLLCLPLLSGSDEESELIGMLYLENNLSTGAFTQERFEILEIIGTSAAGRLELSRKAAVDGLTGLFNHGYFQSMLAQEFAAARRHKREMSLLLIDIDHFKKFNDTWGHQLGDQVLRDVAQSIRSTCRADDLVARYGGEEIAVLLSMATKADALEAAERIRATVENNRTRHNGEELRVTISLGLAVLDHETPDKESLIRRADEALYRSKAEGRNRATIA